MNNVLAYRLWQSPFAEKKLAPVLRRNGVAAARRVLDVGCGPGTNARHFLHTDYLGIDLNPGYVADARRRFGDRFRVADVREDFDAGGGGFDFILVNSLLHHVATPDVRALLARLSGLLTADGRVHILDLVMPERPGLARLLARSDRGEYARPLEEWRALFTEAFAPVRFEPYPLGAFGLPLWHMVYFEGRRR
jgi:SAM-dependent methyltransferase